MATLIAMWLRRVPVGLIVDSRITASKAGLDLVTTDILEAHYLAGGEVSQVVLAMIAADKAGIKLNIESNVRLRPVSTKSGYSVILSLGDNFLIFFT